MEKSTHTLVDSMKVQVVFLLPPQLAVLHALIPALGRKKKKDLCEFKTNLVNIVSSRPGRAT